MDEKQFTFICLKLKDFLIEAQYPQTCQISLNEWCLQEAHNLMELLELIAIVEELYTDLQENAFSYEELKYA